MSWAAWACSTSRVCGPGTRTRSRCSTRSPSCDEAAATRRLQEIYAAPIKEELIGQRIKEVRDSGVVTAAALSPQRTAQFSKAVVDAGVDIFVIRGTTVSAEHVSGAAEPLNLKQFIYELDVPVIVGGCATYTAALHLMRTGAAGVLVGFGGGAAHTTRNVLGIQVPMATAVADVAAARRDYMDESGGRYVHVIADGGVGWSGDLPKAIACGADAVMIGSPLARATDAPGRATTGAWRRSTRTCRAASWWTWASSARPRRSCTGPSHSPDGSMNFFGALRRAMATTGYSELKEFQRVEVTVADSPARAADAAAVRQGAPAPGWCRGPFALAIRSPHSEAGGRTGRGGPRVQQELGLDRQALEVVRAVVLEQRPSDPRWRRPRTASRPGDRRSQHAPVRGRTGRGS